MRYRLESFLRDYKFCAQNRQGQSFSLADDDIFISKVVVATVETLISLIKREGEKAISAKDLEEIITHYRFTYSLGLATKNQLRIKQ